MKSRSVSWIVVFAFLFLTAIRPSVLADIAIGSGPADSGTAIALGEDAGTEVATRKTEEKSDMWPWIIGAGTALVALVIGFMVSEGNKDDAKDAKSEAAASAAAAEAAAAGGAAAEAAAAAAEAELEAAEAATLEARLAALETAVNGGFTHKIFVTGFWEADQSFTISGCTFTPSLTFSISQQGNFPGGITSFATSDCTAPPNRGGDWTQVGDNEILIRVDDFFYVGKARVAGNNTLILQNGFVLRAKNGGGAAFIKN